MRAPPTRRVTEVSDGGLEGAAQQGAAHLPRAAGHEGDAHLGQAALPCRREDLRRLRRGGGAPDAGRETRRRARQARDQGQTLPSGALRRPQGLGVDGRQRRRGLGGSARARPRELPPDRPQALAGQARPRIARRKVPPFDRLAWREPRPSPAIIHLLGVLNRHVLLPHVLRIAAIDLPEADRARLAASVRPGTAAFVTPNHPEFMTDWMIDKELSRRVSPLMAHWASYEVVNIHPVAQWVWLRNNLISNAPGGSGRDYSLAWARRGHGVLLHPEGAPSWRGDRVGPLVPGAVEMAWEACRADSAMPVFVVPVVWKLHFTGDVGGALGREIAHVEQLLGRR